MGPGFPDGQLHDISSAIDKSGEHLEIDHDYRKKGCGVCNRACKLGAITMRKDGSMSEKLFVSATRQSRWPCVRRSPM